METKLLDIKEMVNVVNKTKIREVKLSNDYTHKFLSFSWL